MLTAFGHILQSLFVSGGRDCESLESIINGRDTHVHVFCEKHVLEVQDISRITLNHHARATVGIVHQIVPVRQRIITASSTQPEVHGIAVISTLDIHIGIAVVDFSVLNLFLHLRCRHQRIWTNLQKVVERTILAVVVLYEVPALCVLALILCHHLSHRLHDERHTASPCWNQERATTIRTHHIRLPVAAPWCRCGGCWCCRCRHSWSDGFALSHKPFCEKIIHILSVSYSFIFVSGVYSTS